MIGVLTVKHYKSFASPISSALIAVNQFFCGCRVWKEGKKKVTLQFKK